MKAISLWQPQASLVADLLKTVETRYVFSGTKADQVKMIGNAVPMNTARALCEAILGRAAG